MVGTENVVNYQSFSSFSTKTVVSEMHKPPTVKAKKHYFRLEKIEISDLNALVTIYACFTETNIPQRVFSLNMVPFEMIFPR